MEVDFFSPSNLRQLSLMKLRAQRQFLGNRQGLHRSLKRGHGIEFYDYRQYELGDNPRQIDWGLYGRSDKLYIKRFQEERDISLLIILDASSSMFTPAESGKWDFASRLALSLAYIGLYQQDKVAICIPGVKSTPLMSGPSSIHRIAKIINEVKESNPKNWEYDLNRALATLKTPGLGIVISDCLMELPSIDSLAMKLLKKNLEASFIQILSNEDQNPLKDYTDVLAIDSENNSSINLHINDDLREKYSELFQEHQSYLRKILNKCRFNLVVANSEDNLNNFIANDLAKIGITQ